MAKISILTKRSVFLIFLASSAANPLFASTIYIYSASERYQKAPITQRDVQDALISKGLQNSIAAKKSQAMFKKSQNINSKLTHLYNNSGLGLSREKIIEAFAKYALFDKECDLNSYDSVVGFVQSITPNLTQTQLNSIKEIVKL
ncbi:MAG: hypothetical protein WCY51_06950 [Sulfurimonas sp.]|uniref:hypothetical protein n=1 Tax=Sulfurimonas sp. TaxID=2022749 RepID=UPI0025FA88C1|nr:hypothetical protein [Sulfurimonas sp.]MCK9454956.1 hypothetical protein [Sulfurimonas sp.]